MNISEIDGYFKIETNLSQQDIVWHDAKEDIFVKYGAINSDKDYLRMPRETARSVSSALSERIYRRSTGQMAFTV